MQSEKPRETELTKYARSRQRIADARRAAIEARTSGEILSRERAPWAFELVDDFQERIRYGYDVKLHAHLEFRKVDKTRDTLTVDSYVGGLLLVTAHMETEPEFSPKEKERWVEEMRESIVNNSNGTVSKYTGVRNPHNQKGILVEFRLWFGVEHADNGQENDSATLNRAYAGTPKKKDEIKSFLELVKKTITEYNKAVSEYNKTRTASQIQGLSRD